MTRTVHRTCTLCEAMCGLSFELEGDRVLTVRPDPDDVFSRGYACPKGIAIAGIHEDPDRVRRPLLRTASGFREIGWDEALDLAAERLDALRKAHGPDSIALYWGNPTGHQHGAILMLSPMLHAIGTRNRFSSGSQDVNPRFATSFYLYGASLVAPVPDLEHTRYFLCIGANPLVSNGSLLTAPNMRERIRSIRRRGDRVVVVDPRFTETAREADEHVAVRPGGDAALLLGMLEVLRQEGRLRTPPEGTSGWERVEALLPRFPLERASRASGVNADTIARLAREFDDADGASCYTRLGVCVSEHGTVATWAGDLLNVATGNLGRRGGMLFAKPAIDPIPTARRLGLDGHGRWRSRVRGLPETAGDLPSSALSEEIETPGEGQIRALVTVAGNPVLSTPNGGRLAKALEQLDFMVAVDIYVNETTRHADLILPPAWALAQDHVDIVFPLFAVRNVVRWSPPVVSKGPDEREDWEILLALTERLGGGPFGVGWLDRLAGLARRVGFAWNPTAMAGFLLRIGPYGDRFLPGRKGLDLDQLKQATHGIDLGPLDAGFAWRIQHRDRKVHLAPEPILTAAERLASALAVEGEEPGLVLIGRRELRSNNSWMHNVEDLVSGQERCRLWVHPHDAEQAGIADGEVGVLESRVHRGEVQIHVTDSMRPGVVSLPHGWGHAAAARWQSVAARRPGVSANDWTDDARVEAVVGQSILNGVEVRLVRRPAA